MNRIVFPLLLFCIPIALFSQGNQDTTSISQGTVNVFKKRVLEYAEIDILTSFYTQNGENASVTGGIGTEQLNDFATNINITIPLSDDDILSIDATVSAYSSASSSNLSPFAGPGASSGGGGYGDDDEEENGATTRSPWVESSGASKSDVWTSGNIGYSHSSDDRNEIYNANINFATEYDYTSFGAGIGFTKLFNQKKHEIGFKCKHLFRFLESCISNRN